MFRYKIYAMFHSQRKILNSLKIIRITKTIVFFKTYKLPSESFIKNCITIYALSISYPSNICEAAVKLKNNNENQRKKSLNT